MFSKEVQERLVKKASDEFVKYVNSLSQKEAEDILYDMWNSFCECRGNDNDQLFDFDNEKDLKLWENECGKRFYPSMRFGMCQDDAINAEIHITYLGLDKLKRIVFSQFSYIYQFIITQPWCFNDMVQCIILQPIIKETGLANPLDVGFDAEVVNDELLK